MNLGDFVHILEQEREDKTMDWFARAIVEAFDDEEVKILTERITANRLNV